MMVMPIVVTEQCHLALLLKTREITEIEPVDNNRVLDYHMDLERKIYHSNKKYFINRRDYEF